MDDSQAAETLVDGDTQVDEQQTQQETQVDDMDEVCPPFSSARLGLIMLNL